jgi:hypothetical protein
MTKFANEHDALTKAIGMLDAIRQGRTYDAAEFIDALEGMKLIHATEWIAAIREKAKRNYNHGGWDILVECWEDSDILAAIDGCTTLEEATEAIAERLGINDEMRRDIQAERF